VTNEKSDTPGALELKLQFALVGVQALLLPAQTYVLGGVSYTGQVVAQMIVAWLASFTAHDDAKRNEKTTLEARRQIEPQAAAFLKVLQDFATNQWGANSQEITRFGFEPRKKAEPLTGDKLVLRTARANATRKARGTRGSRQKAAIKGEVPNDVTVHGDGTAAPPPQGGAKP
jgi:hypothetical protein